MRNYPTGFTKGDAQALQWMRGLMSGGTLNAIARRSGVTRQAVKQAVTRVAAKMRRMKYTRGPEGGVTTP